MFVIFMIKKTFYVCYFYDKKNFLCLLFLIKKTFYVCYFYDKKTFNVWNSHDKRCVNLSRVVFDIFDKNVYKRLQQSVVSRSDVIKTFI